MEFKGTNSNWNVYGENKQEIVDEKGRFIANTGMSLMIDLETKVANAKLIAAAPELLEALTELHNLLEENLPIWYLKGHYNLTSKAILKAVAKT